METNELLKIVYLGSDSNKIAALYNDKRFKMYKFTEAFAASSFLKKEKVHAIICDLNLKNFTGIEYFENLHKNSKSAKIIFFLLLEKYDKDIIKTALKTGIDDVYVVPLYADTVYKRIKFLSEIKRIRKHNKIKRQEKYKLHWSKRLFDIVVASTALILLSPLLLIVMILIKLESKGSIFYVSKRVGRGYKIFDFYKFRSMYEGADAKLKEVKNSNQYAQEVISETTGETCPQCEKLGHPCSPILYIDGYEVCENHYLKSKKNKIKSTFIKIENDPRITKVGKFIRNTSIDELPQLINVLKGDMSIVGNRPLPLYEAELLTTDEWSERFLAPAGLTGLWQVKKRGKSGSMSAEERKQLDNYYARKSSFLFDLKLIFMTIPALFQSETV
ncbi:MAG: sugar transferase [Bacteroidales bacterium]|nr:sugar transferase [Bacteroidales bacterium]